MARPPRGRWLWDRLAPRARLLLAVVPLAHFGPAVAQEAEAPTGTAAGASTEAPAGLTLPEAVASALRQGHQAQIAQLEAGRSRDAAGQERSAYLPRAALSSSAGYSSRQNERLEAVDERGRVRKYGLASLGSNEGWFNVYLEQLLLDLSTWRRIERAELEAEAAALAEEQQREDVVFEVVQRFIEAVRQERLAALAAERVTVTEALDQEAELLLRAGRARPTDRAQLALLLEEARIDAASHRSGMGSARSSLGLAMGREAAPEQLDATSLPDVRGAPAAETDASASPELRVLDLRRRVEEKGVDVARAGYLPTVALRGGYSHYGAKRFDNYPDAAQVGINVELPLFQGLKSSFAVDGAAKSAEIARLRYRSALEAKRARVRELAQRLASEDEAPELAARRAAVSRERLRLAELNLRADRGTLDEAVGALGDSVRDGRAAIDAALDRVVVWARLRRETGQLARSLGGPPPATPPSHE